MAGYLANIVIPLGMSPLVRAWLIARLDDLKMSAILADLPGGEPVGAGRDQEAENRQAVVVTERFESRDRIRSSHF